MCDLTLWVQILLRLGVLDTTLCDKVCQWLTTGQWFSPAINWPPQYNWNIVESGIKHHKPSISLDGKWNNKENMSVA